MPSPDPALELDQRTGLDLPTSAMSGHMLVL